ncbi:hypothetical protein ASG11_16950 [Sphingomonas sp. Leaf357]|uniref:hypothetical protein n=1 Tax=Sphingomonas sp. Leaf357 TaxID=1736350 RepID=UPI0006FEB031|nr:hypothetical protein [Sphingomonas sp. Leaf357]KQS01575.1 hypothetical protein ASG11_16950 [Sphingomonas sp. Leaf357]
MMRLAPLLPVLLLAACGSHSDAPGSVSASEAQSLNDAAAMLDANSVDANAVAIGGENEAQPR